jgi:methyl-accepting chemotaxis protein
MAIKDIWTKTRRWLNSYSRANPTTFLRGQERGQPQLDDRGLITEDIDLVEMPPDDQRTKRDKVEVKTIQTRSKAESLEKLQAGFDKLLDKLQGINEHLNRQITLNEELINRIEQLPQLLERFPSVMENQQQITEQLLEQLKTSAAKNEQFIEAVEKIPTETAKQTDALVDIDHQLAAAADADVQMAESFNKFNQTLDKLNQSTHAQTDSIAQMNKTFAASDRYLKYIISRQNKRFMWIFIAAVSVCLAVILILTGIVIYLNQ